MKFRLGVSALLLGVLLGVGAVAEGPPPFSGTRALAHVRALVALGPRPPGSEGIRKARAYLRQQLRQAGVAVEELKFIAQTPRGPVSMSNLVARIPGKHTDIVILAGHYDTLDTRRVPNFVGANDGGSSAAVLLELARVLAARRNHLSIWIVFFDGEEALRQWSARDGLYGSRTLAERWRGERVLPRIRAFILLDMIGDRDLRLRRELNSTPWLVKLVWNAARDLGHAAHFSNQTLVLEDDHLPFLRAGVPAVDLIDYDYGPGNRYWHTADDTLDKLSARSFQVIGEVVLETLRRLEQR
ncbi:MAG: M28 family peptidase [Terriglobia bacterium]